MLFKANTFLTLNLVIAKFDTDKGFLDGDNDLLDNRKELLCGCGKKENHLWQEYYFEMLKLYKGFDIAK